VIELARRKIFRGRLLNEKRTSEDQSLIGYTVGGIVAAERVTTGGAIVYAIAPSNL
jgi:hypothetical protein